MTAITAPDGRTFNTNNVQSISRNNKSILLKFIDGSSDRIDYGSVADCLAALIGFQQILQTGVLNLISVTPPTGPNGVAGLIIVIRGSGFTTDFTGGTPTVTVGPSPTTPTYVDDGTIWVVITNALAPGSFDVVYTARSGQVLTLTNGFATT
jgi:hypothetical protein